MNRQPQSVPQEILINTKVVTSQWRSPAQATQSKSSKITPTQETNPTPPTRQDAKKRRIVTCVNKTPVLRLLAHP